GTLSEFLADETSAPLYLLQGLLAPAMRVANRHHRRQNVVPSLGLLHGFVGKHAAVPADVSELFRQRPIFIAQPVACIPRNIEFTVRIIRQTMPPGLVV